MEQGTTGPRLARGFPLREWDVVAERHGRRMSVQRVDPEHDRVWCVWVDEDKRMVGGWFDVGAVMPCLPVWRD